MIQWVRQQQYLFRQKPVWQTIFIFSFILVIAVIMTLPAFMHGFFSTSWDGRIHLARFQQISSALSHHRLPALVSFIGFGQQLSVLDGMYPWLTAIIFFWPSFLVHNPMTALKLGLLTVNFLTGVTMFLLMRLLTSNRYYQCLGITLYMLNMYHLILLYARVDAGEFLAYLFLPLVLLGCLKIWRAPRFRSSGWCWLALGMIGIANSHILTLVIVTSLLVLIELVRLMRRQVTWAEVAIFALAGSISFLGSIYSLGNIIHIARYNQLLTPAQYLAPITPDASFAALLTGRLNERFDTWNIGLVLSGLLVVQLVTIIIAVVNQKRTGRWSKWTWFSLGLVLLPVSWWPYQMMVETPLAVIQFPGRILSVVVLVLSVATVLYFKAFQIKRRVVLGVQVVLLLMTIQSAYDYATIPQNDDKNQGRVHLVADNYQHEIMYNTVLGPDYLPTKTNLTMPKKLQMRVIAVADNQISYEVKAQRAGHYRLPIVHYQGLPYTTYLNQRVVRDAQAEQFVFKLRRGRNTVTIRSAAPRIDGMLLLISLMTISGCFVWIGYRKLS